MSKLFNSILQGFKEFGEITNNKSLLNQIDEIETSETFEEGTIHKSIYTIDYVDNTGASFKDRIKASSEEDALKKFNKKSKNFVNGVRKIKGHPYIDYLDDDASYDEIDDLTEDTQLKFDGDMINDIDVLYGWRPQEVERILIKHGSDKSNDNWIDGLDLPAAYDEIMSTFRDKYSDDDEIDYDAAKVLGLNESLKESADYYDYPKYSKTLYLPSIRQGKVKLTIGAFSDPRYDDEYMFEILAIVDVESHRTDFTLDSKKLYLKLNINDGHETLSGYDDSYDDLEGVVDEIYDYFMTLDQDDIDDTLIELADDFDVNRVKQMFGPIDESLKESLRMSRDDFDRMCKENGILQGLSRRDYIEIRDLFHAGSESFDSAVNDLWHGDNDFHSRDWYEDLLKKYTDQESLEEDTVKKANGKWTNRDDDGTEHGEFDTKKEADAQRKAMFAKGYKGENYQMKLKINEDSFNETFTEKDFNDYVKHTEDNVRRIALSISRMMQEHDEYYELFENLVDELVDILRNVSDKSSTESLKLKESTDSLDDYKAYEILINALVPNSVNLARYLSPNGECYNEIVDVLKKNGLNLAEQWIDYKENPELTKRLHDMGIVHGNSTIEELTDKVLKKLDDNGYDTSDKDVRNYAEAAAELIINDVNQDIDDWYSETLINYPEDLEELPKK